MRTTLERDDIIRLLGKALNIKFDPDKITIRTDPLEIVLPHDVIEDLEQTAQKPMKTTPEITSAITSEVGIKPSDPSLDELMGASDALTDTGGDAPRVLHPNESREPPPPSKGPEQR